MAPGLVGPALQGVDLVAGPQQVLNVMPDLVGDHVSLGEIARGLELLFQLLKEAKVEVDLLIGRAVKRPDGRAGVAAGRSHSVSEEHKCSACRTSCSYSGK